MSEECGIEVRNIMEIRASSIDLLPNTQIACRTELADICSGVKNPEKIQIQKGFEVRCLQVMFAKNK